MLRSPSYYFLVVAVKLIGFSVIYRQEVGVGVIRPQWTKELFEGGMQAESNPSSRQQFERSWESNGRVHHLGSSWTVTGSRVVSPWNSGSIRMGGG